MGCDSAIRRPVQTSDLLIGVLKNTFQLFPGIIMLRIKSKEALLEMLI